MQSTVLSVSSPGASVEMKRFVRATLVATILGALVFVGVQIPVYGYGSAIVSHLGNRIVADGNYPSALAQPIGWGVHLGVSLSYALLFGVLFVAFKKKVLAGLVLAILLGVVTSLITAPAITATISLLSGNGFPNELPQLNTDTGLTLWNHLGFFGIACLAFLFRGKPKSRG